MEQREREDKPLQKGEKMMAVVMNYMLALKAHLNLIFSYKINLTSP